MGYTALWRCRAWMRGLQGPAAHSLAMKCLEKGEVLWGNLWCLNSLYQQVSAQSDGAAPGQELWNCTRTKPHLSSCWWLNPTSITCLDHLIKENDLYLQKRLWWNIPKLNVQEGTSAFSSCSAPGAERGRRGMYPYARP